MSPEQASDQTLGESSDWYSVGAMLYEALTGQRPFEGDSEQVMTRKQTEQPVLPAQLAPDAPVDLAKLCMALLQPGLNATDGSRPQRARAVPSPSRVASRAAIRRRCSSGDREPSSCTRRSGDARGAGCRDGRARQERIGKSTLVRRFLRGLGDAVFVVEGRCFEREAVLFKSRRRGRR
jgi:serine/threonine protein kinase